MTKPGHIFTIDMIELDLHEPAIRRGIKTVGVGKKGSKPLTPELIQEIITDFKNAKVTPAQRGAFFGALTIKGLTEDEKALEQIISAADVLHDAPKNIVEICTRLLNKEELDKNTAKILGDFLLSNKPGDGARGLVASILRVRYETADEYEGLLLSLNKTLSSGFKTSPPAGQPIIQIAEPFDGVDQSYMITPLLGEHLRRLNYRVIQLVGRNSGPKLCLNAFDIARRLNVKFLQSNNELINNQPTFGFFIDQKTMSPAMDRWVDIRREIIKRPFMSTLERFVNPSQADILIASAFHPPYGEKMLTVAERAGFKAAVIVRNGIEGTIAAPLLREIKALISVKQSDGNYTRHELSLEPSEIVGKFEIEEKIENPSVDENVRLIKEFQEKGETNNKHFNARVKVTTELINRALGVIKI